MGTNKRRSGPWSIGLLILACFGNVCFGEDEKTTIKKLVDAGQPLSCYVCNSLVGKCDPGEKVNCTTDYLTIVYGGDIGKQFEVDLKEWPKSLSELAKEGAAANDSIGWNFSGFPSSFGKGVELVSEDFTHRFSSLGNLGPDYKMLKAGFRSCRVMKITVDSQKNGAKQVDIPKNAPRVIRSCSFVDPKEKSDKATFDGKGCRLFNYKSAAVEVCYCTDNDCNASPYLHGSYWMIAASVLVLLAQMF